MLKGVRILSVTLTPELGDHVQGLQDVQMRRLGQVVAVAGPNGAGKTRLLRVLGNFGVQRSNVALKTRRESLKTAREQLSQSKSYLASIRASAIDHVVEITQFEQVIASQEQSIANQEELIEFLCAVNIEGVGEETVANLPFLTYLPKGARTQDYRAHSLGNIEKYSTEIGETIGFGHIERNLQPYVVEVHKEYWNSRHPDTRIDEARKRAAEAAYEQLNDTVEAFLGERFDHAPGEVPKLFGRPLPDCNLSDGQNVLLKLALAMCTQGQRLDGSILFLDEPETHLHPKALADFLARLRQHNPNGQIWITTHSLHLLAQCEQDEIWFIEAGVVRWGGRAPERVIRGLTGDEHVAQRLVEFMHWPVELASARFAAECLVPPDSVWTDESDEQCQQIRAVIEARALERPCVLDWGAGKGRILGALRFDEGTNVDYYAFEPGEHDAALLEGLITEHYQQDGTQRVFSRESDILESALLDRVDIVVMCNVLHEIPPQDWLRLFSRDSALARALADEGHLLLVEDQLIPKGEMAHHLGFTVLGKAQLRELFDIPAEAEADNRFTVIEARGGRLTASLISKSLLTRITAQTRKKALQSLATHAKLKIRELRGQDPSYRTGRAHGFWAQQFVNASLAVEEL